MERESGCLGLTLRGGADYPLIVTHVRPLGPVYKTGRIKPGDRLLRVDNVSLFSIILKIIRISNLFFFSFLGFPYWQNFS